jgi:hypothetical protein
MPILIAIPGFLVAVLAISEPLWFRPPLYKPIDRNAWLTHALPWLRSGGLLYLAVVAGWVSMRDAGLAGQTAEEWLAGGATALALGAIGGWLAVRYKRETTIAVWIQDETRWTLYRAVVWPLLIFIPLIVPAVWLVAVFESWMTCWLAQKTWDWMKAAPWLIRATGSAVLFAVAHNLYLAVFMYLVVWATLKLIVTSRGGDRPSRENLP